MRNAYCIEDTGKLKYIPMLVYLDISVDLFNAASLFSQVFTFSSRLYKENQITQVCQVSELVTSDRNMGYPRLMKL